MPIISTVPSFSPCCPECGAKLEGVPFPLPRKGVGRCPAAGNYEFEISVDDSSVVLDKDGNAVKKPIWETTRLDNTKHPKK